MSSLAGPTARRSGASVVDGVLTALTKRRGPRPTVVWDLDGTLLDPLPRMLHVVHAFGRDDVGLGAVRRTWQATARVLRIDPARFYAFWHRHYWDAPSFALDTPITPVVRRALRAQALRLHNVVLTGRTADTRNITAAQLERLGLSPEIVMKPRAMRSTPAFKASWIASEKAARDAPIVLFVTDSVAEVAAVRTPWMRATAPELCCVFCRHPKDGQRLSALPRDAAIWPIG